MKHNGGRLVGLMVGAILFCASALAQNAGLQFTLQDLGTFGGTWSAANAINSRGQVVGTFGDANGQQCFVWQSKVAPVIFQGNSKAPFCDAKAVGRDGTVAGAMRTAKSDPLYSAFRRDPNGTIVALKPLPNALPGGWDSNSYGYGVAGKTVVGSSKQQAVMWDSAGNVTEFFPGMWGEALGINDNGQIVGVSNTGPWLFEGHYLFYLPYSGVQAVADAINNNGVVIGVNNRAVYVATICPAEWSSRVMDEIGCGLGLNWAISNDNWAVSYLRQASPFCLPGAPYCYTDNCGSFGSCPTLIVSDPNCSPTNLNSLLDASGTGWTLYSTSGINEKHQIVGWGIAPSGELHAVFLTPNNLPLC